MSCVEWHPWAGYLVTSGAEERIDVRSGGAAGSSAQAERRSQFRPHVTESDAGLGTVDLTSKRIPLHTRNSLRGDLHRNMYLLYGFTDNGRRQGIIRLHDQPMVGVAIVQV